MDGKPASARVALSPPQLSEKVWHPCGPDETTMALSCSVFNHKLWSRQLLPCAPNGSGGVSAEGQSGRCDVREPLSEVIRLRVRPRKGYHGHSHPRGVCVSPYQDLQLPTLTRTQGCQLCSGTAHLQLTGGARVSEEPRHCGAGIQDFSITKIRFATDSKAPATMSKVSLAGWVVSPERVSSIVQTSGEAPIPRGSSGQVCLLERGEATAGCGGKAGNCNIPGGVIRAGRLARQLMAKCEAA